MDESIVCECGYEEFWYFGDYVRCPECLNEMKLTVTGRKKNKELWLRRFNHEEHKYSNWGKMS